MSTPTKTLSFLLSGLFLATLVRAVELPDPLKFDDGTRVTSTNMWEETRRGELLELFREHVYGRDPVGRPEDLRFERIGEEASAFDGAAVRQRVRISYKGPHGESGFNLSVYYPAKGGIRGCLLLIVNRSPRIITQAEESPAEFWPAREIVARGYATAAFHNGEVAIDRKDDQFKSGVFGAFGPAGAERKPDDWGAIGAWAWGASRALDYLETQPRLNNVPLIVAGHSRGGKTALWCGAQDKRVALAISNDSGTAGAALARVSTGETIRKINTVFPHWFSLNYRGYGDRERELPVDQHELIALLAPRLAYVASASKDDTSCPAAEFQACVEAAPVYALYGLKTVVARRFPDIGQPLHEGSVGYHIRAGEHDLKREDWERFLDFADARLSKRSERH